MGQRRDYSAVAVVERIETAGYGFDHLHWMRTAEGMPDEWVVRHLERMALGTPYTAVTARVVEVVRNPKVRDDCRLVVDATGVGMPVVDMLRAAHPGCEMTAVVITGGTGERYDKGVWYVPKVDLLARLQGVAGTEAAADCAADAGKRDAGAGVAGYPGYAAGEREIESGRGGRGRA